MSNKTSKRALSDEARQAAVNALGEAVCALFDQGLTLPAIAVRRGMPNLDTLQRWVGTSNTFRRRYQRAAALRAEVMADAVVTLADLLAGDSLAGAKLRIDARKWRAEKFRKDAEREEKQRSTGPDPDELERRLNEGAERVRRWEAVEREEKERERAELLALRREKEEWERERAALRTGDAGHRAAGMPTGAAVVGDPPTATQRQQPLAPERPPTTHRQPSPPEAQSAGTPTPDQASTWHVRFDLDPERYDQTIHE